MDRGPLKPVTFFVLGLVTFLPHTGCRAVQETRTQQPPEINATLDPVVLDLVLRDLLAYKGDDSPVAGPGKEAERLLFSMTPSKYPTYEEQILRRRNEKACAALTPEQADGVREAARHLLARKRVNDVFRPFKPTDKRVQTLGPVSRSSNNRDSLESMFDRPIAAYSPGYSKDRRIAVVHLSIPWSIHYANGTYVLVQKQGVWSILLRQFVYYL